MQSYKMIKSSETVLFPIENELKLLRQENDKSWTTLMSKILAVVFSGIGTTLLCQESLLPALVTYICDDIMKKKFPFPLVYILQLLIAIGIFLLLTYLFTKFINWKSNSKDNKRTDLERENLAEYFHKVILNNIITGKSFTKKAEGKMRDFQNYISQETNGERTKQKINEFKGEFCLYLSEALYYFTTAEKQMMEKKIIEIGQREKYMEYLGEVGVLTLAESLLMFERSIGQLKQLFIEVKTMDKSIWGKDKIELLSIDRCLNKITDINRSILQWHVELANTMSQFDPQNGSD